jgi:hypothetical protein
MSIGLILRSSRKFILSQKVVQGVIKGFDKGLFRLYKQSCRMDEQRRSRKMDKHEQYYNIEKNFGSLLVILSDNRVFTDNDGDVCIYLGVGGKRGVVYAPLQGLERLGPMTEISFEPMQHVYACMYKGDWQLFSFEEDKDNSLLKFLDERIG